MDKIIIYSDGGSRGNPGPAGIGVVIDGKAEISKCIGTATNNQAEYTAVIEALKWVLENSNRSNPTYEVGFGEPDNNLKIELFLDSQLVVEQLNQRYKLKNEGLKPLFNQIQELIGKIGGKVTFSHIPREKNVKADKLVNKALDEAK